MERVVTYLYPREDMASSLKVFQDRTNQIRGFYFTRDNIKNVEDLEFADNYSVYFLFDRSEDGLTSVYIGQSKNGIRRMSEHNKTKDFWSYCLMFTTDNNSFDALTIDYLEYYFINSFRESGEFRLMNKDPRSLEPTISIYDRPTIRSYISQIEFLLEAEGVSLSTREEDKKSRKYYYPRSTSYRDKASIYFERGKFILSKGSIIGYPSPRSREWKDKSFYIRNTSIIDELRESKKIKSIDGDKFETLVDLPFKSPSAIGDLMVGQATNGWEFFEGLDELRD